MVKFKINELVKYRSNNGKIIEGRVSSLPQSDDPFYSIFTDHQHKYPISEKDIFNDNPNENEHFKSMLISYGTILAILFVFIFVVGSL